eukprot:TRINITY_DN18802_c0_g2_i1.p1 TRINITY_DN18802_c0_g2~~TRINITY_DN18802_c0_g2_i1.p1  ORF type:complete len:689 (-),score=86.58 TRINITY_DN18802_c0_g2_i1:19-1788(-)
MDGGKKLVQQLVDALSPVQPIQTVGPEVMPYFQWQRTGDLFAPHGKPYYLKSGMIDLNEDVMQASVTAFQTTPGKGVVVGWSQLGGAVNDVASTATAYPGRSADYTMEILSTWDKYSGDRTSHVQWTRELFNKVQPHVVGVYNNFIGDVEDAASTAKQQEAYGHNLAKLQSLKQKYDPAYFFHGNINIPLPNLEQGQQQQDDATSSSTSTGRDIGVGAANTALLKYEGVNKKQEYNLSEHAVVINRAGDGNVVQEEFDEECQIETLDIGTILGENVTEEAKDKFAQQLGNALHHIGFAVLVNTGIPVEKYEKAEKMVHSVFELDLDTKMKYRASRPKGASVNQGYFPHKETSDIHPDLVEGWVFSRRSMDLEYPENFSGPGPDADLWPPVEGARTFFSDLTQQHTSTLVLPIMRSILRYLKRDEHSFDERLKLPQCALRLNYYPPVQDADDAMGAARLLGHEDVTLFTLLPAPQVEGLQVLNRHNNKWIRLVAPKGAMVLNTGDYMQRLTNDWLPSTTHRVSKPRDKSLMKQTRVSFPLNIYLWEQDVLETIKEREDKEEGYPPVRAIYLHTAITEKYYGDNYAEREEP